MSLWRELLGILRSGNQILSSAVQIKTVFNLDPPAYFCRERVEHFIGVMREGGCHEDEGGADV